MKAYLGVGFVPSFSFLKRRNWLAGLAVVGCLGGAARGDIVSFIGGTLRVDQTNVAVNAKFLGSSSLFTNELYLDSPLPPPGFPSPIFNSTTSPVGGTQSMGTYQAETVLFIRDQSFLPSQNGGPASFVFNWFTGDGELPLNPDHLPHAVFSYDTADPTTVRVGFEDILGGGDFDFNDAVYSFTNVHVGIVTTALTPDLNGNSSVANGDTRTFAPYQGNFNNTGTLQNEGSIYNYGQAVNDGDIKNLQLMLNDLQAQLTNNSQFTNEGNVRSFGLLDNSGILSNKGTILQGAGTMVNLGEIANTVGSQFTTGSQAIVNSAGTLINSAGLSNGGTFNNSGSLQNDTGGILENLGTGQLGNLVNGIFHNDGDATNKGLMTNAAGGIITNDGTLLNSATFTNSGETTNNSVLNNGVAGILGNLGKLKNTQSMTNNGSISNSGTLINDTGAILGNNGTIQVETDGVLQNDGELDIDTSGRLIGISGSSMKIGGMLDNLGFMDNKGVAEVTGQILNETTGTISNGLDGILKIFNKLDNDGSLTNVAQILVDINAKATNNGQMTNGANGVLDINGEWENAGSILGQLGSQINNTGSIVNTGTTTIDVGAALDGLGSYFQDGGATTLVNGILSQGSVQIAGGLLKGSGRIEGFVNTGENATIAPGNSPGTLEVDGSAFLNGSTLEIELASSSSFDVLKVTGDVEFDEGTLKYIFSYTPQLNQEFVFLTAGGHITGLDSLTILTTGPLGLLSVETHTEVVDGLNALVATVVPEPASLSLLGAGAIALFARRRRAI